MRQPRLQNLCAEFITSCRLTASTLDGKDILILVESNSSFESNSSANPNRLKSLKATGCGHCLLPLLVQINHRGTTDCKALLHEARFPCCDGSTLNVEWRVCLSQFTMLAMRALDLPYPFNGFNCDWWNVSGINFVWWKTALLQAVDVGINVYIYWLQIRHLMTQRKMLQEDLWPDAVNACRGSLV